MELKKANDWQPSLVSTTFNIGLLNNPYVKIDEETNSVVDAQAIEVFLIGLKRNWLDVHYRFAIGQWYGDEPTAVVLINSNDKTFDPMSLAIHLTQAMTQTAISYKTYGEDGQLVYNPNYTGDKYVFDDQYFIEF